MRDTVITFPIASVKVNGAPGGPQKTGFCSELGVGVADTGLVDTGAAGSAGRQSAGTSLRPDQRSSSTSRGSIRNDEVVQFG